MHIAAKSAIFLVFPPSRPMFSGETGWNPGLLRSHFYNSTVIRIPAISDRGSNGEITWAGLKPMH
jgi:hypothetical protein